MYIDFFRYFERAWKPNCKYKNIKIIPEWNYYNIINSIEFDVKYLYLTNNIAEHINKLLNSKFQTKYLTFESWKTANFSIENDINNKTDYIERVNFGSQIIIYFLKWNYENKNNKDLLKYEDIKIMNTSIKPDSNIGNCISFRELYDLDLLNIKEKDDNKDCIIQSEMERMIL